MANGFNVDPGWLTAQFPDLTGIAALGGGGFKRVFSARHAKEGNVVLKLIHPQQSLETTRREILAVNQVQSQRVPKIIAVGQITTPLGNSVWFLEQRVMGATVREMLRAGPLSTQSLLKLALHILETLASAEAVRIVHRDVKPENLICDATDDFWLIDFGIARHLQLQSQTASGLPFGKMTMGYAPPEQCNNVKSEIDSRADLFALGVTMYECADGRHPFLHPPASFVEVLRRVESLPLVPLQFSFPAGREFWDLLDAMTKKRRDHRPRSAREAFEWMQEIFSRVRTV
ncbi:MAG: serine/threonine protein kinase [Acidobacteriota bacterium]|nr:serine/threonine protein kinase [Acidobacteriota bacterium]